MLPSPPPAACEIRVLATPGEHTAAYRLRHDIYTAMGYRPGRAAGLEIDEFDTRAVPAGAFDPATGALIGVLRLVTTERQPRHERIIRQIVADAGDGDLARVTRAGPGTLLPSAVSGAVLAQVRALTPAGSGLFELGRGIVRDGYRGAGVMRRLIEFGIACAARAGPATIIGSCLPAHVAFYARHGFAPLPGAGLESFPSVGQDGYVLIGYSDRLPEPTQAHVNQLLRDMRGTGTAPGR